MRYLNLVHDISNGQLYHAAKFGMTAGVPLGFSPRGGVHFNALGTFLRQNGFKIRRRPVGMLWAWRGGR